MRRRHRGLCCARQFKSSTEGRRRLPPTSTPTVRAALDQRRRVTTVRRLLPVRRNSIKSTSTAATAMITHTHGSMTRLLPLNPDPYPRWPSCTPRNESVLLRPFCPRGQPSGIGSRGRPRAHHRRVVARRTSEHQLHVRMRRTPSAEHAVPSEGEGGRPSRVVLRLVKDPPSWSLCCLGGWRRGTYPRLRDSNSLRLVDFPG